MQLTILVLGSWFLGPGSLLLRDRFLRSRNFLRCCLINNIF